MSQHTKTSWPIGAILTRIDCGFYEVAATAVVGVDVRGRVYTHKICDPGSDLALLFEIQIIKHGKGGQWEWAGYTDGERLWAAFEVHNTRRGYTTHSLSHSLRQWCKFPTPTRKIVQKAIEEFAEDL